MLLLASVMCFILYLVYDVMYLLLYLVYDVMYLLLYLVYDNIYVLLYLARRSSQGSSGPGSTSDTTVSKTLE